MNYEQLYIRRIINKTTHEFIRDIDLREVHKGNDIIEAHELAITAPACQGNNHTWDFELESWVE